MKIAAFIWFVLHSAACYSQQPTWRQYTSADGLPSNEVYQVLQDQRGYMWFATDGGVSVFDGKTYRNFSTENGLPDNTVLGMFEAANNKVWFRTLSGHFFYIDETTLELRNIKPSVKGYLPVAMFVDEKQSVFVSSNSIHQTNRIDPPYGANDMHVIGDSTVQLNIFLNGKKGCIYSRWLNSADTIAIYNGSEKREVAFENAGRISKVLRVGDALILSAKEKNYLLLGNTIHEFAHQKILNNAALDHDGNLIICLANNEGVLIYNGLDVKAEPRNYFSGISISSVFCDREDNLWLTSTTSGVLMSNSFALNVYSFNTGYNNKCTGVYCLPNGKVVGRFFDNTYFYPSMPEVKDMSEDDVLVFKNINYNLVSALYGTVKQNLPFDETYVAADVFSLKNETGLWAVHSRAIVHAASDRKITTRYVPDTRINGYHVQHDSIVWLATLSGLWQFTNGNLIHINNSDSLLNERLDDVVCADNGDLWLCSRSNGVMLLRSGKLHHFTRKHGLASDICRSLIIYHGKVWVGTNRGISVLSENKIGEWEIKNISLAEGLPSAEINMLAWQDDKIWVASDAGIFSFNAHHDFVNHLAPLVYVTEMRVNGELVEFNNAVSLESDQNNVRFSIAGISYKYPKANTFKYQMVGLDTVWHTTENCEVVFTTLPPGDYSFTVYALNNSGVASEQPVSIQFTISSPFWQRWWFVLLVVLALVSLVYFVFQKRLKRLQNKADEKTKLAQQMAELEMRALRAQMNPHFIFNCINSIQHFILDNDKLQAQKQLASFARLIRNVLENSRQDAIPLQIELETLELYIQMESLRFESKFTHSISLSEGVDRVTTLIPPMIIQPFVENAIIHGLLPLQGKNGKLNLHIEKSNGHIKVVIDDNGIGRQEAAVRANNKSSGHTPHGINITMERLQMLNSELPSNSHTSITILDKQNADGTSAGTTVTLLIPKFKSS